MTKIKRVLSIVLSLTIMVSLLPGLSIPASSIAYNEADGPRTAGELTSYIYGDFVTSGDVGDPFGYINPWSAFDWLTNGDTITLAYCGPSIATEGTDLEGMGEYGYLGTASMPEETAMGNLMMVLLGEADNDVRVYFFNLEDHPVNVSFHIQSTSNVGFSSHSVASVVTPEGRIYLDEADTESHNQNLSADIAITLAHYEGTAPAQYYGDYGDQESVRPADDPVTGFAPEGCFYISLTTQPQLGNDPSAGVIISNFYAAGDSDTLTNITLQAPEHGSYTATAVVPDDDPDAEEGATVTVTETVTAGGVDKAFSYLPANGFTLSATGDSSYDFDYWSNGGNIISYDNEFETRAYAEGETVVASFLLKSQTRAFDVNGTRYVSWFEAVNAAQDENAVITLVKDYTFAATEAEAIAKGDSLTPGVLESNNSVISYILPAGVKFLIPYNAQDSGSFADGPGFSVAAPGSAYKTLTVPANVTFTVNGKLNVNACAYANNATSYMGGASGDYGFIDLSGTLDVESGGEIRVYGYVAGSGRVNVKSGGSSFEVLQMADWGGGSNAMAWNNVADDNLEKSFYFSQYYVQNVESDYRVYAGASAYVYGHLTATMSGAKILANVQAGFIGNGETLFTMSNGYIERRYDGTTDRITYDVHGDMEAKAINVDVMSIATVASRKWLLGLTNNMDVIASEGTTTLSYGYMVLPDTRIVVEEGASVVIGPSAKVHIWRVDDWQNGFVGGPSNKNKTIVPIRYTVANGTTPVRTTVSSSGALINNGTVTAYSNVFTTDNGGVADDMVIQGSGTLINYANPNGTVSGTLWQLKKSNEWVSIQTEPVLSYMYGETEVSSFEAGTYYSQPPATDTHGNGTYDSWYQWQVDYTLTDENGDTINYTDYAYNSDIDLDGTLIVDGERYVITSVDSIKDANDNDLSATVDYDGNVTVGGLAVNTNANIADGWEAIQFHGLAQNVKIALHVQSYDYRVIWQEPAADKTTAEYVIGNTASYDWDQNCAISATVTPASGATATPVYGLTTSLLLTNITEDVEVSIVANADAWPVTVNITYPDNRTETVTIFSTQDADEVWTTTFAPAKPANGWYVIDSVSITGGSVVSYQNNVDNLTITGVNTSGVVANVTLAHKDYKITYNTTGASLAPSYVNSGETVNVSNTALGDGFIFGEASITTTPTEASLAVTPTSLTLTGIDKDLTLNVPVVAYDYIVTADGQTAYVLTGDSVTFTLDAGYAINGASIPSNQVGTVSYTNPADPTGTATITVTGVGSDVDVTVDKVQFDAIITFKDADENVLETKYYGAGSTITYTAADDGVGSGNRFFIEGATSTGATVSYTTQTVSVTNVTGTAADVIITLTPFTYKVTWNDGVETTYTYLTGAETEATYIPPDEGVGGARYIIQTAYGEHASGATNDYPASNGKSLFKVVNINSDEVVTLTLRTFTYKVVFTNQNDNVIKTQYADAEDHDVTINVGDNTIRYDVAGQDLISTKNTIITSAEITGTATANNGADFGEGVSRVTLTGIASDVTAKLEVYEYDHKVVVVRNDLNGWSSDTETHYVSGDAYAWTKPADAEYAIDSVSSTYGTATKSGDTVNLDMTGVSEVEVELVIVTKLTAERLKTDLSQFTNYTNATATIAVTDSAYGVFTVTCSNACVIAYENADGTYTRLTAMPTETTNTYEFVCPNNFPEDIALVVVVKGDADLNGRITAVDATRVKSASIRKWTFNNLEMLAADVDGNGRITTVDATRVKSASIRKWTFDWANN